MPQAPSSPEELFLAENGMTVEEAWDKVTEWNLAGKKAEAIRGAEIIVHYFPNHPAKELISHLQSGKTTKAKGIVAKFGDVLADSMENVIRKKKTKEPQVPPPVSTEAAPVVSPVAMERPKEPDFVPPETPVLDDERLFATISYAWIFCIIPLLLKRESVFIQFHAKQGLVMALLLTIFDFTVGALLNVLLGGIGYVLKLIYIGFLAYAAYQAYQGKYWKIPGVYAISTKIKF